MATKLIETGKAAGGGTAYVVQVDEYNPITGDEDYFRFRVVVESYGSRPDEIHSWLRCVRSPHGLGVSVSAAKKARRFAKRQFVREM